MVVRFAVAVFSALAPIVALTVVAYRTVGEFDPLRFVPVYLGTPSRVAPGLAREALEMVPRTYLVPFVVLSVYSLVLLAGMYLRWKPIFYLMLTGVAVRFALAVVAAVLGQYYGLLCGGLGATISVASFLVVMSVQDDFAWDLQRVHFQIDRRAQGGAARLERARACAERGMWALAALYLRGAVAKMPGQIGPYTRLAHAYLRLKRPDLARTALEEATRIDPHDPRVQDLAGLVREHSPR
jgi:tetratricopeptide (TPR) repeat protein